MITDGFGPRMVANIEIALERACKFLPDSNDGHEARRYVASKILECAKTGKGSVRALTEAGRAAAIELHAPVQAFLAIITVRCDRSRSFSPIAEPTGRNISVGAGSLTEKAVTDRHVRPIIRANFFP